MAPKKTSLKRKPRKDAGPCLRLSAVCPILLTLPAHLVDIEAFAALFGDFKWRTLPEVARAFGISPNTVSQSWRQSGMPGVAGNYHAAAIVRWVLQRNAKAAVKAADRGDDLEKRQAIADARKSELQVERLEIAMAEDAGRLIDREVAGTAFRTILSELTEDLSTLGEELETEFPIDTAKEKVATINRAIARRLKTASEKGARIIPTPKA